MAGVWAERRPRLRTRVVVSAAVSILVAVAVLGLAVQLLLARHLHGALDTTLRERAAGIARLSASTPALVRSPEVLEQTIGVEPLDVEVVNRQGGRVSHSLSLGDNSLPAGGLVGRAIASGRTGYTNGTVDGEPVRMFVAPLADLGGPASGGAVIVAAPTGALTDTLSDSRGVIVLSGLAAALLAAGITLVLAGRALEPLRRLAAGAETIEARGDPALRLPDAGPADEVQRLAETLNRMLAALERSREGERRFVADASHELRNPLAALRGNAAYLARHGADQAALDDLVADAERLSRLVDELLALAREDSAGPPPAEEVRMAEVAEAACAAAADPRLALRLEDEGWVAGDRPSLERALANLVENARAYGPAGEPVEVAVERVGEHVAVSVSDRGPGIPAAQAELATQRFWRGPNAVAGAGSGLGLSLVRATVERHGGRLDIRGARLTMLLPALRHISEPPGRTSSEPTQGVTR
ncbi:MAG TPA: HAMP domain-containing sensor histidine kinase [Gaiellales bacterium]|jgi:signal transduction histidine kinase|nr:HAMP domain-containing sensor histidine kinase [Gaiellales bacterium]